MKQQQKAIGDVLYTTETYPAMEGLAILAKLIKLVGGDVLGLVVSMDSDQRIVAFQDPKVIGGVLGALARNAAEPGGLSVVKDLLARTEADKIRIGETEVPGNVATHFDDHFAGRLTHLAEVLMWVVTVNFIGP